MSTRDRIGRWALMGVAGLLLCSAGPSLQAQRLGSLFASKPPARRTEHAVAMRDGAKLMTDVILPEGNGPWPVVLTRTPYGKRGGGLGGIEPDFVGRGYARVTQDIRGRFQSEGTFGDFVHERTDGYDTVEWIAKQPWCNGSVGMFGVSAGGILSNFAAMEHPEHLKCAVVAIAHGCDYRFGSMNGGVYLQDLNDRWFRALGQPIEEKLVPRIRDDDADSATRDLSRHYGDVRIPILNIGGWFDIFADSTIENFEGLQSKGGPGAKGHQRLVVGAFAHLPIGGALRYPPKASFPDFGDVIPWFDRWLKGKEESEKKSSVRYFVMGDTFDKEAPGNVWRQTNDWPPESKKVHFYLAPGGGLRESRAEARRLGEFTYDPRDPVPTIGGANLFLTRGPLDQKPLQPRKDILRFESDPLAAPLEVVGRVYAKLFVQTDVEDTDFMVKLIDVYPNGYEALMLDQPLRLRYRDGFDRPRKASPGQTYSLSINLWTTALVFNKGHKIAVHVSSSNAPRYQPHTNTWAPVSSYDQAVIAHNKVVLGGEDASSIVLPVVTGPGD